jgi:uncharacterized membrane protein
VPAPWVSPANIGVDRLTAVYVSMGITPPHAPASATDDPREKSESNDNKGRT